MSDLKIQGEVQISAEGAESALNRVGDKAEQMATRLTREADKAGKAVDGIGSGADKNAEQFTRAEGRISDSIKRATTNLELLGKTASQKLEIRISEKGLDAAKFEPMLAKLRELEAAQIRAGTSANVMASGMGPQFQNNLKNTSFQLQDMIVQMNGGVDATKALGQQLPQMLVGFGAAGAAVGVLAALLPNLVSAFTNSAAGAKTFKDALAGFDQAIGAIGQTTKSFDMENLYEEFNQSSDAVRAATIEQLNFQREYLRTTQLVAGKKFGESLGGMGEFATLDKLAGAFGSTGAEKLSKQLGVTIDVAEDLLPVISGLKNGSEDVGLAFSKFGTVLLSGNQKAIDLATTMATLAKSEKDAAAASSAISEAQAKMAEGHVKTKKETDEAAKSTKKLNTEAEALAAVLDKINGKDSGLDATYWKDINALHAAYSSGKLSIDEYRDAVGKLTAAQKFNVDADKESLAAIKARSELVGKLAGDEHKRFEALAKGNERLTDEIALLGLTKQQQGEYSAAKIDAAAASDLATASAIDGMKAEWEAAGVMPEIIAGYEALAEAKRASARALSEQAYMTRQHAAREVAVDQAKESAKAWQNFSRDIESSLTDALYRSFEAGGDFGETFARNLERTFKTMALKAAIQYVVSYAGNAASSFVGNATGGAMGNAGSAANQWGGTLVSTGGKWVYQQASPYIDSSANYIGSLFGGGGAAVGSYAGYGTSIAATSSSGGLASSVYGSSMANATPAASSSAAAGASGTSWLPIIGWIIAGMTASNELSRAGYGYGGAVYNDLGDKTRGLNDQSVGNTLARLFSKIGIDDRTSDILSAAPIDNNAMNWLLGKKTDIGASGLQLDIRDGQLASGAQFQDWWSGGGRFHGAESGTNFAALTAGQSAAINDMLSGVSEGFLKPFNDAFATDIKLNFDFRAGGEGFFKAIEAQLVKGIAESDVKDLFVGITDASGMMAAMQSFANVQTMLEAINQQADIKSAGTLAVGMGSEQLTASLSGYYEAFFSEQEKAQKRADDLAEIWAQNAAKFADPAAFLGGAQMSAVLPKTEAEFRQLVEALDLTGAAGRTAFAYLMQIAPAFDQVASAAAELAAREAERAQGYRRTQADAALLFLDDADLLAAQLDRMQSAFAAAGLATPTTAADYRGLIAAQDAGSAPGQANLDLLGDWARVFGQLLDAQLATAEAAAQAQLDAQALIRDGWQSVADSIADTMRRLRGDLIGERGFAAVQAEFAIASAAARAGDQTAAASLPELARAVVDLGREVATSSLDQSRLTAATLASLSATVGGMAAYGITLPQFAAGTNFVPADMVAQIHQGERIIPAADNGRLMQSSDDLLAEVRALRAELTHLRAETRAVVNNTFDAARVLERVMPDGDALEVRVVS